MVLEIQRAILSMENVSWEIFGDTCKCRHVNKKIVEDGFVGSNCMETAVARPIT